MPFNPAHYNINPPTDTLGGLGQQLAALFTRKREERQTNDLADGTLAGLFGAHDPSAQPEAGAPPAMEQTDYANAEGLDANGQPAAPPAPDYKALARAGKASHDLLELAGLDPQLLKTKSAEWKLGMVKGVTLRQTAQEVRAKLASMQASQTYQGALTSQLTRQGQQATREEQERQAFAAANARDLGEPDSAMTPDMIARLVRNSVTHNQPLSPGLARLLEGLGSPAGQPAVEPREWIHPTTKKPFAVLGNTLVEATTAEDKAASKALKPRRLIKQRDAEGDIIPGLYFDEANGLEVRSPTAYETITTDDGLDSTTTRRPITAAPASPRPSVSASPAPAPAAKPAANPIANPKDGDFAQDQGFIWRYSAAQKKWLRQAPAR